MGNPKIIPVLILFVIFLIICAQNLSFVAWKLIPDMVPKSGECRFGVGLW